MFLQKLVEKEGCRSFLAWISQGSDINLRWSEHQGQQFRKIKSEEETKAILWKRKTENNQPVARWLLVSVATGAGLSISRTVSAVTFPAAEAEASYTYPGKGAIWGQTKGKRRMYYSCLKTSLPETGKWHWGRRPQPCQPLEQTVCSMHIPVGLWEELGIRRATVGRRVEQRASPAELHMLLTCW